MLENAYLVILSGVVIEDWKESGGKSTRSGRAQREVATAERAQSEVRRPRTVRRRGWRTSAESVSWSRKDAAASLRRLPARAVRKTHWRHRRILRRQIRKSSRWRALSLPKSRYRNWNSYFFHFLRNYNAPINWLNI